MMKVQAFKIGDIKPYKNNPRQNDGAVGPVANSIEKFGWQQPIVVDKKHVIIVGHTRYKAALKLGLKVVPVVVAKNLDDEQARAYRLADNKTNELSSWDDDKLDQEMSKLLDFDMSDFGFDVSNDDVVPASDDELDGEDLGVQDDDDDYILEVQCNNKADMEQKYNDLKSQGYKVYRQ